MLLLMMFSGVQGFVTVPGLGLIVTGAAVVGGGVGLDVVATVMVTTGVVVVVVVSNIVDDSLSRVAQKWTHVLEH